MPVGLHARLRRRPPAHPAQERRARLPPRRISRRPVGRHRLRRGTGHLCRGGLQQGVHRPRARHAELGHVEARRRRTAVLQGRHQTVRRRRVRDRRIWRRQPDEGGVGQGALEGNARLWRRQAEVPLRLCRDRRHLRQGTCKGNAARGRDRNGAGGSAKARAKFNELIKNLLPQADDAVLMEFSRLAMDEYRALQAQDPYACYRYAAATEVDENVIRMIPPDLVKRETSLHEKIILSAQKRDKTPSTEAAWIRIRANLVRKGYSTAELQAMCGMTIPPSSHARYCAVSIYMHNEIIRLPAMEASVALREMYAEG